MIKKNVVFAFVIFSLLFPFSLFSQEDALSAAQSAAQSAANTNIGLLHYYDTELFQWDYDFWMGQTLNFQNQSSRPVFSLKPNMVKALSMYEDSYKEYKSYRKKTIPGHILMWTGLTAVILSPLLMSIEPGPNGEVSNKGYNAFWWGLTGSAVISFTGSFTLVSGQVNLYNAVNSYNRNRIRDYQNL